MSMNTQIDLSKLCGRKISDEEATRIREVASNMELRDDDAIWQLLAAIEYQKSYYDELPEKIRASTTEIINNIREVAELETKNVQAKLTESVINEAKFLSSKIQCGKIYPLFIIGIVANVLFGSLAMWLGYQMGICEVRPIIEIFVLPVGLIFGTILCIFPFSYLAILIFLDSYTKKQLIINIIYCLIFTAIGIVILYFTGQLPYKRPF